MLPRPRRAAQPVLGLRFSAEALRSPEMVPVELPALFAPSKRPPTAVQQRQKVVADDHRPASALLGKAVAPERAARAVRRLGVEEPPVFLRLARTKNLVPWAIHDVVLRVVAKPAKRHAALGRVPIHICGQSMPGSTVQTKAPTVIVHKLPILSKLQTNPVRIQNFNNPETQLLANTPPYPDGETPDPVSCL